jgi:hypothetical protein
MTTMRCSLRLSVLLYVVLDFANPLMPGAVRFEGGSVVVVQADRVGREATAAVPVPASPRIHEPLPADPGRELRLPAPAAAIRPPLPRDIRRVAAPRSDLSPFPTEDH